MRVSTGASPEGWRDAAAITKPGPAGEFPIFAMCRPRDIRKNSPMIPIRLLPPAQPALVDFEARAVMIRSPIFVGLGNCPPAPFEIGRPYRFGRAGGDQSAACRRTGAIRCAALRLIARGIDASAVRVQPFGYC